MNQKSSSKEEGAVMEKHPRRAAVRRFIFMPFWQRIHRVTGADSMGNDAPPLTDRTLLKYDIHENKSKWNNESYSVASLIEDGHEVWFGYSDEWKWSMSRKNFNKMILNYLLVQIRYNWFGLRQYLYFKSLHKMVEKRRKYPIK